MARAASAPKKEISMEEALWKSADKLRGSVEPAEYKHVVLSLFFLKFASDKFEAQRKAISEKYGEKFVDNVAFYTKDNEVLDDVAEQLAKLLEELKKEKDSFKGMGIDYEEKAFYDILKAVAKKYEFEYPDDKMIELSKRIKIIVDDKAKYTDWSTRDDIKANLQVDLILLLDEFDYPPRNH